MTGPKVIKWYDQDTPFLKISKTLLDPETFPEDAWFEIQSKTLKAVWDRFGKLPNIEKFKKEFSCHEVQSKKVLQFHWEDNLLLEVYHTEDKVYAKIFTGRGTLHGNFPKEWKQGRTMVRWLEFRGKNDNRKQLKSVDGEDIELLLEDEKALEAAETPKKQLPASPGEA